jgi:hypothetical protein
VGRLSAGFQRRSGVLRRTVALVGDRWERPGLGQWDVRSLVGHTSRALLTVESYLARPAAAVDVPSAADYFRATSAVAADPAVAARGRDAGTALGSDPATAVAEIAARVLPIVDDRADTELVTTIAGGMRLGEYLPTRDLGRPHQRVLRRVTSPREFSDPTRPANPATSLKVHRFLERPSNQSATM